jgi:hypothetical protein
MLKLAPPEKPLSTLRNIAASELSGAVKARRELTRRLHQQLETELKR